jgi:hypothetical protein
MNRRQQTRKPTIFGRLLEAAQRRYSRARPGSVLVMVVALLVMLALIGTAAMSTARIDRVSAVQHTKNVQLDILADGVRNMVLTMTQSDLFNAANGEYRDVATSGSTYDNYDYPGSDPNSDDSDSNYTNASGLLNRSYDAWLGSRLPEVLTNTVAWRFVSFPPFRNAVGAGYRVDSPQYGASGSVDVNPTKTSYVPTFLTYNGKDLPAFTVLSGATDPFGAKNGTFLAADTDGDGIADALLFKLAAVGDLTYYGAYRIIDNNSAVNVNTALLQSADFVGNGTGYDPKSVGNDAFFPSNIGMAEFLQSYDPNFSDLNSVSKAGPTGAREFSSVLARKNLIASPSGLVGGKGNPLADDGTDINTFKYRTLGDVAYMGLGRRLDWPGRAFTGNGAAAFFGYGTRPYGLSDALSLAYRFCLRTSSQSPLETDLNDSAVQLSPAAPYGPGKAGAWFNDNFLFATPATIAAKKGNPMPVRSVFVTYNPTSNAAPSHGQAGKALYLNMQVTPAIPLKISINTAPYEDLWRGFYEVMCTSSLTTGLGNTAVEAKKIDDLSDSYTDAYYGNKFTQSPVATGAKGVVLPGPGSPPISTELHPGRMFRNPIRNSIPSDPRLSTRQVMALRSALAAVNTVALREGSEQVVPRVVTLEGVNGGKTYTAAVFGYARQPFITEIFAHTDINQVKPIGANDPRSAYEGKVNRHGFVAVELHNPYDEAIPLNGWQLAIMNRVAYPRKLGFLFDNDGNAVANQLKDVVIPAHGYVVLHNFRLGADEKDPQSAQYWPFSLNDYNKIPPAALVYVPQLSSVLPRASSERKELVLLRPIPGAKPIVDKPTRTDELYSMAPVDSFDFTGLVLQSMEPAKAEAWHYSRANDPGAEKAWAFVYPGRYNGRLPTLRHQGIDSESWDPAGSEGANPEDEPWALNGTPLLNSNIKLGLPDQASTRNPTGKDVNIKDFQIQLANTDMPGYGLTGAPSTSTRMFPFGGFARLGDILQVPFIGAYTILDPSLGADPTKSLTEMNAITMDSVFAEDTDIADDGVEEIGRFCPLTTQKMNSDPAKVNPVANTDVNDFDPKGSYTVTGALPKPLWHYRWTMHLFDYFTTINNPHDDYLPNMGDPGGGQQPSAPTMAVPNGPDITNPKQANRQNELTAPVEGLININTAGWRVLAALPFATPRVNAANRDDWNEWVAKSIAYYRDDYDPLYGKPHGPFASLYELNDVPIYDNANKFLCYYQDLWRIPGGDHDADDDDGDFSPDGIGAGKVDQVRGDFEEKFLSLNRISNLVTLRSDCYTAYIVVQAWRNAGSTNANFPPTLEGQRRLAVIIDRSRVTSLNKTPTVYNVPTSD